MRAMFLKSPRYSKADARIARAQKALKRLDEPYQAIFDKTGLSISWLSKFAHGKIPNPGIRTLEALEGYLSLD